MLNSTTRLLISLYRAHRSALGRRLGEIGLRPGAELLLAEVAAAEGITHGELAARLGVKPPTVTKLLAALERDALVERSPDADDARILRISLTPEGGQLIGPMRAVWGAAERETLAPLSSSERDQLRRLLERALTR